MTVGFTGTRRGLHSSQKTTLASYLQNLRNDGHCLFLHGQCVGADVQAAQYAYVFGYVIHAYPCNLKSQQGNFKDNALVMAECAPLDRNRHIVDDCKLLIACPYETAEVMRSGTWATVRYARYTGRSITMIMPDGSLVV